MNICCKFDGRKQINRSHCGSWEGIYAGAALRVNVGPEWEPTCSEKVTNSLSNQTHKAVSTNWTKQLIKDKKHKAREDVKLKQKHQKTKHNSRSGRGRLVFPIMTIKVLILVRSQWIYLLTMCMIL